MQIFGNEFYTQDWTKKQEKKQENYKPLYELWITLMSCSNKKQLKHLLLIDDDWVIDDVIDSYLSGMHLSSPRVQTMERGLSLVE